MDRAEFEMITSNLIAVYAGELWYKGSAFEHEFGADSIRHLYEYANLAKTIEMPLMEDGITIDTEAWRNDVYQTVLHEYKQVTNMCCTYEDSELKPCELKAMDCEECEYYETVG